VLVQPLWLLLVLWVWLALQQLHLQCALSQCLKHCRAGCAMRHPHLQQGCQQHQAQQALLGPGRSALLALLPHHHLPQGLTPAETVPSFA
jgi:hypothetical protein